LLREQIGLITIKERILLNNVNVYIRNPINYITIKTFLLYRYLEAVYLQKVEEEGLVIKGLLYLI
jgi:hypothetical protein